MLTEVKAYVIMYRCLVTQHVPKLDLVLGRLQGSKVTTYSVHPGLVLTNLGQYLVSPGSLLSYLLLVLVWPFSKTIPQVQFLK